MAEVLLLVALVAGVVVATPLADRLRPAGGMVVRSRSARSCSAPRNCSPNSHG